MSDDTKHDYVDYMEWRERVLMPYLAAALGNVRPLEGGSRQAATFIAEEAAHNAWSAALASRPAQAARITELESSLTSARQLAEDMSAQHDAACETMELIRTEYESRLTSALKERDEARAAYAVPVTFVDCQTPDGRDIWIAWIDYMAQGRSRDEALMYFAKGWRRTVEANEERGITPRQMVGASYPDTAEQTAALRRALTSARDEIRRYREVLAEIAALAFGDSYFDADVAHQMAEDALADTSEEKR